MNKILARKWVNALRSGKYKQTTGTLQNYNGYCCLGVLCEISGKQLNRDSNKFLQGLSLDSYNLEDLTGHSYGLKIGNFQISLANLNDGGEIQVQDTTLANEPMRETLEPFTFDEIADIIQIEVLEGVA